MASRPSELPRWADVADPSDVVEPSEGQKNTGWAVGQRPPAQNFNWLQNNVYNWLNHLSDFADNLKTAAGVAGYIAGQGITWGAAHAFSAGLTGTTAALTGAISGASAAISGAITAGSAAIAGAITAASAAISGNATVGGTLDVTGATNLGPSLTMDTNATLNMAGAGASIQIGAGGINADTVSADVVSATGIAASANLSGTTVTAGERFYATPGPQPSGGLRGQIYFDTSLDVLRLCYADGLWINIKDNRT